MNELPGGCGCIFRGRAQLRRKFRRSTCGFLDGGGEVSSGTGISKRSQGRRLRTFGWRFHSRVVHEQRRIFRGQG
jgi:hypothetical protein